MSDQAEALLELTLTDERTRVKMRIWRNSSVEKVEPKEQDRVLPSTPLLQKHGSLI